MSIKDTLIKIIRGEPLDWHLRQTLDPNETFLRCARCSCVYVAHKRAIRTMNYCWNCL